MNQEIEIRNLPGIQVFRRNHPEQAQRYAEELRESLEGFSPEERAAFLACKNADEFATWASLIEQHDPVRKIDPFLWNCREIAEAPGASTQTGINQTTKTPQHLSTSDGGLGNAAGGIVGGIFAPGGTMQEDRRYNNIRNNRIKEWEKANKTKIHQTEEGITALYGSADGTIKSQIETEAEKQFREKHQQAANKYDKREEKRRKKIYRKYSNDPHMQQFLQRAHDHAVLRHNLLSKEERKNKETWKNLYNQIAANHLEEFVAKYPEKAEAYAKQNKDLQKALDAHNASLQSQKPERAKFDWQQQREDTDPRAMLAKMRQRQALEKTALHHNPSAQSHQRPTITALEQNQRGLLHFNRILGGRNVRAGATIARNVASPGGQTSRIVTSGATNALRGAIQGGRTFATAIGLVGGGAPVWVTIGVLVLLLLIVTMFTDQTPGSAAPIPIPGGPPPSSQLTVKKTADVTTICNPSTDQSVGNKTCLSTTGTNRVIHYTISVDNIPAGQTVNITDTFLQGGDKVNLTDLDGGMNDSNNSITWTNISPTPSTETSVSVTFTATVNSDASDTYIANQATAELATQSELPPPGDLGGDIPPNTKTCGGRYTGTNFGDPICDLANSPNKTYTDATWNHQDKYSNVTKQALIDLITQLDSSNLNYWLGIASCESSYNPNSIASNGTTGLFQMGHPGVTAVNTQYGTDQFGNYLDDGYVQWRLQTSHAIDYEKALVVAGLPWHYWECAETGHDKAFSLWP